MKRFRQTRRLLQRLAAARQARFESAQVNESVQVREFCGELCIAIDGRPYVPVKLLCNGEPTCEAACKAVEQIRATILAYRRTERILKTRA